MSQQPNFYIGPKKPGYIEKYGIQWKKGLNTLDVELFCFREKLEKRMTANLGGVWPHEHFMNAAKILWPEKDPIDPKTGRHVHVPVKFVWTEWAVKMLKNFCKYEVVTIAGGSGFGKSQVAAIWLIINFLCDPSNTLCFATSTTIGASKKRIWGKIVQYWTPIEKLVSCGKLVDSMRVIRYVENGEAVKGDLAGITLVPAEKKKEKDALEKLRGMHQLRIIFCADELGALSPSVPEAAFMNLKVGTKFFRFVGTDNPYSYVDAFGEISEPLDGWNSITIEDEEWPTKRGKCLHFDLLKNPNILAGRKLYDWMPTQEDIDKEIAIHGGKTSAFYQMYRGFWPQADVVDQIYTEVEIINSKGLEKAIWRDNELVKISFLDPSFTNGGDRTISYFATVGLNLDGIKTLQFDEFLQFKEDVTDTKLTRPQQLAYWWMKMCLDRGVAPRMAGMDSSGTGMTLAAVIHTIWSKDIFCINFGSKASDKPVSAYDPTPSHERYVNAATELWVSGKEYLRSNQVRGISREMMTEMVYRKLDRAGERNLNVRMKLVPKSEMKIKYGKSPDIAEAGLGCIAIARERLALDSSSAIKKQDKVNVSSGEQSFKSLFRKFQGIYQNT